MKTAIFYELLDNHGCPVKVKFDRWNAEDGMHVFVLSSGETTAVMSKTYSFVIK